MKPEAMSLTNAQRAVFALLCVAVVMPVFLVTFPPAVDLPQHVAQAEMLIHSDDVRCDYPELVTINWRSPYLLAYLLTLGFAQFVSVPLAIKLTFALAIVGVPLGFAAWVRALGRPAIWCFLGFPLAYSFAVHWGFFVFAVAIPIGFLFLAATVRYVERPTVPRAIGMSFFLLLVFAGHALLAGFCGGIALLLAWRAQESVRRTALVSVPFLLLVPVALMWATATQRTRADARDLHWGSPLERIPELVSRIVGEPAGWLGIAIGGLVLATVFITGGRSTRRPLDWLPLYAAVLWFLGAPVVLFGTALIQARFHVFALGLLLLAVEPPRRPRFRWLPIAIAVIWILVICERWLRFESESADLRAILEAAPPDRRSFVLVLDPSSAVVAEPVYLHFPLWYQATGGCLVEPSFARSFPSVVRYREGHDPDLPLGIELEPRVLEVGRFLDARWPLIFVRSEDDQRQDLLRDLPLDEIARSGSWWLFARRPGV